MTYKKGIVWALGTAVLSGVSVYVNTFGPIEILGSLVMILGIAAVILPPVRAWATRRAAEAR